MSEKNQVSRRGFLASATTGLVTASMLGLGTGQILAQDEPKKDESKPGKLIMRELGKTGMKLPIISMGVGGTNNPALVKAAYEAGVRMFDTASNYGYGRNEQLVGQVIEKMGVRDKVAIATKTHVPNQRRGLNPEQSKAKFLKNTEGSLSRLRTDYVDIMYVHDIRDPETVSEPGAIEALKELKKAGKVKAAGIATHSRMAEVIRATIENKDVFDVVLTAINFTMWDDTELLSAIAEAHKAGIGVVAMKTQAGGSRWPNPESRANYSSEVINVACLKWVMQNENICTSIPGYQDFEQLGQDFAVASNTEFNEDESRFMSDNSITLGMGFCRQCRKCLASCPNDVEIPDLMRIHMYSKQYGNFELARQTMDDLKRSRGLAACVDCSACSAQCANTVDIPTRIEELKLIYA